MQKHQEHREARHTPSCGGTSSTTDYGYMIVKKKVQYSRNDKNSKMRLNTYTILKQIVDS